MFEFPVLETVAFFLPFGVSVTTFVEVLCLLRRKETGDDTTEETLDCSLLIGESPFPKCSKVNGCSVSCSSSLDSKTLSAMSDSESELVSLILTFLGLYTIPDLVWQGLPASSSSSVTSKLSFLFAAKPRVMFTATLCITPLYRG